jgi:hypothetical protein
MRRLPVPTAVAQLAETELMVALVVYHTPTEQPLVAVVVVLIPPLVPALVLRVV